MATKVLLRKEAAMRVTLWPSPDLGGARSDVRDLSEAGSLAPLCM